jgi:hypothetical protein
MFSCILVIFPPSDTGQPGRLRAKKQMSQHWLIMARHALLELQCCPPPSTLHSDADMPPLWRPGSSAESRLRRSKLLGSLKDRGGLHASSRQMRINGMALLTGADYKCCRSRRSAVVRLSVVLVFVLVFRRLFQSKSSRAATLVPIEIRPRSKEGIGGSKNGTRKHSGGNATMDATMDATLVPSQVGV